jgi:hypothetical protein
VAIVAATSTSTAGGETNPDAVFYHGTSVSSGLRLLNGAPLSLEAAAANKIDGPLGFYLATDPAAAEFFAGRRETGMILQYDISGRALNGLIAGGAALGPIPQGRFPFPFPGTQLAILPSQFVQFNSLVVRRSITILPYRRK